MEVKKQALHFASYVVFVCVLLKEGLTERNVAYVF
jgi:hypothetical protein